MCHLWSSRHLSRFEITFGPPVQAFVGACREAARGEPFTGVASAESGSIKVSSQQAQAKGVESSGCQCSIPRRHFGDTISSTALVLCRGSHWMRIRVVGSMKCSGSAV